MTSPSRSNSNDDEQQEQRPANAPWRRLNPQVVLENSVLFNGRATTLLDMEEFRPAAPGGGGGPRRRKKLPKLISKKNHDAGGAALTSVVRDRYHDMSEQQNVGDDNDNPATMLMSTTATSSVQPQHPPDPEAVLDFTTTSVLSENLIHHKDNNKQEEERQRCLNAPVPSLKKLQKKYLKNKEASDYRKRSRNQGWRIFELILEIFSTLIIYLAFTATLESVIIITHAVLVTYFFFLKHEEYAVKLDFAFLAFAVIFPLTFLIQSTFNRREEALRRLMDFKAGLLSLALFTFTVDWPESGVSGSKDRGRLALPASFHKRAQADYQALAQLVYEYLSMPSVSHARHLVFHSQQKSAKRVHAVQNEVIKYLNEAMYDIKLQVEVMRHHGFGSSEASRLHQYHQYLQQRFEHLRALKYYRTPQATRAFGRAYMYLLPWLVGPYFAWVLNSTEHEYRYAFALTLAAFTYLVLLGLLNTQRGMEDPFVPDESSGWTPGVDNLKLEYEFASTLQSLEQYYARTKERTRLNHVVSNLSQTDSEVVSLDYEDDEDVVFHDDDDDAIVKGQGDDDMGDNDVSELVHADEVEA
mmetsp:Transcript_6890/g.14064  ORF Transcript_6890/g.14064 Transcript_6890/m.14064 type:complete len:583 (-) Transcript_6890:104-1852(-)